MTSDPAALIAVERAGLRLMFTLMASARETDLAAQHDHRYSEAAASIRRIAATLHQVDDAAMVKLASVDQTAPLSSLIAQRLVEVGFALPLCADATAFFRPLVEQADAIMQLARSHLH
jgi:hypothetical protein